MFWLVKKLYDKYFAFSVLMNTISDSYINTTETIHK